MKANYNNLVSQKVHSKSLGDIPKNYQQMRNHKRLLSMSDLFNSKDDYFDAIVNMHDGEFVRNITFHRNSVYSVCFTDQSFHDLIRFCAAGDSIMNVDTTFNLGEFYVTIVTYRNLTLIDPRTEKNPVCMAAIMVHTRKERDAYIHLAHTLESYYDQNKRNFEASFRAIKRVITDDDENIRGAFRMVIPKAEFYLCCNHLSKNFSREMPKYIENKDDRDEVLRIVFGTKGDRKESMISCKSKEEMCDLIKPVREKWAGFKNKHGKSFEEYFMVNKFDKIYHFVIKPNKSALDLEKLVEEFLTTNDVESINHVVKEVKSDKVLYSFSKIHAFFRKLIDQQENDMIMALRQSGDYSISKEYSDMKITAEAWCYLPPETKRNRIKSFLGVYPKLVAKNNITAHIKKVVKEDEEREKEKKKEKKQEKEEKKQKKEEKKQKKEEKSQKKDELKKEKKNKESNSD